MTIQQVKAAPRALSTGAWPVGVGGVIVPDSAMNPLLAMISEMTLTDSLA